MKKLFAILMSVLMIACFMPIVAFADGNVAKIGDDEYATLADAISAAKQEDTVVLMQDATGGFTVEGKSISLDLNGKTLTTDTQPYVKNDAVLTIKDSAGNGEIKLQSAGFGVSSAKLILNSGLICTSGEAETKASDVIFMMGSAQFEMNGGALTAEKGACIDAGYLSSGQEIKITGGTVATSDMGRNAIYIENRWGEAGITATISGGEFRTGKQPILAIGSNDTKSAATITGGTFSDLSALDYLGDNADVTIKLDEDLTTGKDVNITGGKKVTLDLNG